MHANPLRMRAGGGWHTGCSVLPTMNRTKRMAWAVGAMLVAGCAGGAVERPWDKNRDGLVQACEGLSPAGCAATPGCEGQQLACTLECRSDGQGGCLPCDSFACLPKPSVDCGTLDDAQCAADPRCELGDPPVCLAVCEDDGTGGCKPSPCDTVARCHSKPPFDCSQLPVGLCSFIPACQVVTDTYCLGVAGGPTAPDAFDGGQPRCGNDDPTCHTVQRCENRQPLPPLTCEQLPLQACAATPGCAVESGGAVCDVACLPGSNCPPCAQPQPPRCVTVAPVGCASRDTSRCAADGACMLESFACPAVCDDDGKGGCKPCDAPPPRCVELPAPPPTSGTCEAILGDPVACQAAGCTVEAVPTQGPGPSSSYRCVTPETSGGPADAGTPPGKP